ncbi:Cupredoxin-like domain-containing protein [Stigmatella aurantiaca]|uniref:Cupredoxin-like domain-containing protein n=1 Tax=Stigmatella aurantiaca TaxID=41 RepID=A0A1H7ZRJ7_STIAU|nr:cupredoxin domain-containing protein [Stigmatella aurantiaca]SEM61040.1 Cupredoxin-like domain-containing protein [Stigmatella aurantiaca]
MKPLRAFFLASTLALLLPLGASAEEAAAPAGEAAPAVREIEIIVDRGYKPVRIEAVEGERVRLKFVRREYTPCTREVILPSLNIRQELPPNKPVTVDLPPLKSGDVEFMCGMKMFRGTLVVTPRPG